METVSSDKTQQPVQQLWSLKYGRLAPGDKTCNAHVFYFHNGEALLPRIWTDYEDQRDDLFAVYSSYEDFTWCQNDSICHQKTLKVKNINNVKKKQYGKLLNSVVVNTMV